QSSESPAEAPTTPGAERDCLRQPCSGAESADRSETMGSSGRTASRIPLRLDLFTKVQRAVIWQVPISGPGPSRQWRQPSFQRLEISSKIVSVQCLRS